MRTTLRPAALVLVGALLAACTGGASSTPAATATPAATPSAAAPSSPEPAESGAPTAPASPSAAADSCSPDTLETQTPGMLTIGTDNPAFPPYYDPPAEGEEATEPWELGDPTNKRGFEAAVAWAIAEELGYSDDQVEWIAVPFDQSFAPGEKDFDIYLTQVSDLPERREAVDMSDGYYFLNQALVALEGTPIADATSIAELKEYTFGAQVGTTSFQHIQDVIQPTPEPLVYNSNDAAIEALSNGQIDGLVVDLPTAFFVTAVQVENGVVVGQFPTAEGEQEHFSVVLEKDSPLTDCVNGAIRALEESGELEAITQEWLAENVDVPVLE